MSGVSASQPSIASLQVKAIPRAYPSNSAIPSTSHEQPRYSSNLKLTSIGAAPRARIICNCSSKPRGPGESESRSVLDAFLLGKALAEALNERIESAVGEFLSTIGRLQAEQQKQVQDFQDDVLERAKRAKEKAAREAMEAQGLISKSTTTTDTSAGTDEVTAVVPSPSTTAITLSASSSSPPATYSDLNPNKQ